MIIKHRVNCIRAAMALSFLTLATPGYPENSAERSEERQGARDTRQIGRQDARDDKQDCKANDWRTRPECRTNKRETKQDSRGRAKDIKRN